jgi:hypothetical protein
MTLERKPPCLLSLKVLAHALNADAETHRFTFETSTLSQFALWLGTRQLSKEELSTTSACWKGLSMRPLPGDPDPHSTLKMPDSFMMFEHPRRCTGRCLLLFTSSIDAFRKLKTLYVRLRLELADGCHTMHALNLKRFGRLQDAVAELSESWGEGEGDEGSDEDQEDAARRVRAPKGLHSQPSAVKCMSRSPSHNQLNGVKRAARS